LAPIPTNFRLITLDSKDINKFTPRMSTYFWKCIGVNTSIESKDDESLPDQ